MADYHVGCGLAGIYAGTLNKKGDRWLHKSDVTNETLCAAAQYLMDHQMEFRFCLKHKLYTMKITEQEIMNNGGFD